jgi:predicted NBD/HSP70 family sugar kinase
MVLQALRHLGQAAVDDQVMAKLRHVLSPDQRRKLLRDARYTTDWIAAIVQALLPELTTAFCLGGGVAEMGDILLDRVREVLRRRVSMFPTDGVQVERSALGERAGLLGAIALAARGLQ